MPETRPLNLPKCVIFLADTEDQRKLAYDTAHHMASIDHTTFVDAFESPIVEAYRELWELDYHKDYNDPRTLQGLSLDCKHTEWSERDIVRSLKEWFYTTYSRQLLGTRGLKRYTDQQSLNEYIYIFIDGIREYVEPFAGKVHPRRDILLIDMRPGGLYPDEGRMVFAFPTLMWIDVPTDPHKTMRDAENFWEIVDVR